MKPAEWSRLALAIARVLHDSDRTDEIHVAEELTGRASMQQLVERMRDTSEGRRLLDARPELCSSQVDYDALRKLDASTLGGAYVRHLDAFELSADSQAVRTRYVADPDVAYMIRRFRQTHDVWHALTGLGTAGYEEVLIHAFSWGQLRLPVSALVIFFGALKHMVLEARWLVLKRGLSEAYQAGLAAQPLMPVYWEDLWQEPLAEIRERFEVRPLTHEHDARIAAL